VLRQCRFLRTMALTPLGVVVLIGLVCTYTLASDLHVPLQNQVADRTQVSPASASIPEDGNVSYDCILPDPPTETVTVVPVTGCACTQQMDFTVSPPEAFCPAARMIPWVLCDDRFADGTDVTAITPVPGGHCAGDVAAREVQPC